MEDFLWVEKYRPRRIVDCILPKDIMTTMKKFASGKEIPNLLLSGTSGTGKTTVARALCEELGADYIIINGSDEGRQIDTLRNKIKDFASTVSLSSDSVHKVVIVDEADYMNPESVQPALRNFIETFHKNCRFIFTCNYKNKILPALHSRCTVVDFRIVNGQKKIVAGKFMKSLCDILEQNKVEYDKKVLAEFIMKYFPDFRRVLNELQRYSVGGKIDSGILAHFSDVKVNDLIKNLKEKNFPEVRKWVVDNLDNDPSVLLRHVYDALFDALEGPGIAAAVLIIARYQYQIAFVADQEINLLAALTEIMVECNFK